MKNCVHNSRFLLISFRGSFTSSILSWLCEYYWFSSSSSSFLLFYLFLSFRAFFFSHFALFPSILLYYIPHSFPSSQLSHFIYSRYDITHLMYINLCIYYPPLNCITLPQADDYDQNQMNLWHYYRFSVLSDSIFHAQLSLTLFTFFFYLFA